MGIAIGVLGRPFRPQFVLETLCFVDGDLVRRPITDKAFFDALDTYVASGRKVAEVVFSEFYR